MMTHAPADGITVALSVLALALIFLWAWIKRIDERRRETELNHLRRLKYSCTREREQRKRYIDALWFDIELDELLEEKAA